MTTIEMESKTTRDTLERVNIDKEQLQRQISAQNIELDRIRQVKYLNILSL